MAKLRLTSVLGLGLFILTACTASPRTGESDPVPFSENQSYEVTTKMSSKALTGPPDKAIPGIPPLDIGMAMTWEGKSAVKYPESPMIGQSRALKSIQTEKCIPGIPPVARTWKSLQVEKCIPGIPPIEPFNE